MQAGLALMTGYDYRITVYSIVELFQRYNNLLRKNDETSHHAAGTMTAGNMCWQFESSCGNRTIYRLPSRDQVFTRSR